MQDGLSVLQWAAVRATNEVIGQALARGADINVQTGKVRVCANVGGACMRAVQDSDPLSFRPQGETALFKAVKRSHLATTEVLLEANADCNITDRVSNMHHCAQR